MKLSRIFSFITSLWLVVPVSIAIANPGEAPSDQETQRGMRILDKCKVCHSVGVDDDHAAGPNLFGIVDRPVGKVAGYKFSRAMRKAEGTWTPALLDKFITSPAQVYPGNRMAFSGLKKEADRSALIAVLASLKN